MHKSEVKAQLIDRAEMLIKNLRNCNSACDVHEVGNMKNVAEGIKCLMEHEEPDLSEMKRMLDRLEKKQVEFFKKKFQHLKNHDRR